MNGRPHGTKPALALWMLVAILDVALLTAAAGVLVMVLILAVVGGGVLAVRAFARGNAPATDVVARRRA